MKIVFVSNYYNHHQSAISEEFYKQTGGSYVFIATAQMSDERKKLGYSFDEPSLSLKVIKMRKRINIA